MYSLSASAQRRAAISFGTQPFEQASRIGRRFDFFIVIEVAIDVAAAAPKAKESNWFTPSWWWLLAAIPVLILISLILVAALRNRRAGDDDFDRFGSEFDADSGHDTAADAESLQSAGSDEYGRARLAESYGRPSAPARPDFC